MTTNGPQPSRGNKRTEKLRMRYREVLQRPTLTDQEVETLRIQLIRLAQAVCEHVWKQKLY